MTNIDCSSNEIGDALVITDVLGKLPNLVAVNMAGNGVNNTVGQFRKKVSSNWACGYMNMKRL